MIYLQATMSVIHEKLPELVRVLEEELMPAATRHGMTLVGSWRTFVGTEDELTDIWCFESMEHMAQVMRALGRDEAWREGVRKARGCVVKEVTKLMSPVRCSPLK